MCFSECCSAPTNKDNNVFYNQTNDPLVKGLAMKIYEHLLEVDVWTEAI